jgi:hypothetical protein
MQLICIEVHELPAELQARLRGLAMAASMRGGQMRSHCTTIAYDTHDNALTVTTCKQGATSATRFQFDEPQPQYRWN